ncbi:mitochondrial uncoupling protein 4-like [Styela clava]
MSSERSELPTTSKWKKEIKIVGWKYAMSAAASTIAETVTFPLDLTKTRLQIQGEHANTAANGTVSVRNRGMVRTAVGIVQEEGITKLWQGLPPAVYRHLIYTGVRMGAYEQIREILGRNSDGSFPVYKAVIGGLCAGSIGQFVASPMDLVKVQMQMEGRRRMEGHPPRVRGVWHALSVALRTGGIRGLWVGWVPNVQRAALVNMGDLATYDTAKHAILRNTNLKDDWMCHGISSILSGFTAATLGTPADVVKTRIMNQPRDKHNVGLYYKSSIECLMKTVRKEGFFSLYKGFIPIWSRMAPWSLTFWLSLEKIRQVTGTGSF